MHPQAKFLLFLYELIGREPKQAAYYLATVKHETGGTFKPITEWGPREYFDKYEPGTNIGDRLGNSAPGDGYRYRGRGYIQITGLSNYQRLGQYLKVDLVADPDLALEPKLAFRIMHAGLKHGLFTGRKISEFIRPNTAEQADYKNARRCVNGTDKADLIAGHAREYEAELMEAMA